MGGVSTCETLPINRLIDGGTTWYPEPVLELYVLVLNNDNFTSTVAAQLQYREILIYIIYKLIIVCFVYVYNPAQLPFESIKGNLLTYLL